jgi:hypothetical protein
MVYFLFVLAPTELRQVDPPPHALRVLPGQCFQFTFFHFPQFLTTCFLFTERTLAVALVPALLVLQGPNILLLL